MNDYDSVQPELLDHGAVTVGRYILHRQIARGGMATIHIARLMGDEGFSRIVAAKRLLPEFAEDSEFVAMFLDEARIASKVHHRNVVPVLDLVTTMGEVVLVQEYVHGVPLHWLMNRTRQHKVRIPVKITVSIACQVLAGLHAAHEMVDELGTPLNVVHRDVSPQNVMIASDGSARLLDFGVAKATMAAHVTREGTYKGKLAYSAPEQLRGAATRQSDIYSLSVMLWELLVGHRMHRNQGDAELVAQIMSGQLPTISEALETELEWQAIDGEERRLLAAIEPIVRRGLALDLNHRWSTASEMEEALLAVARPASSSAVAQWLKSLGKEYLDKHEGILAAEEQSWRRTSHAIGSRYTPLPSSIRTSSVPGIDLPSASGSLPRPPERKSNAAMFAILGFLVVALAVGITWLIRSPNADSKPQEPPGTGVQPLPAATLPAQAPEATVKRDVPPANVPAAAAAQVPPAAAAAPTAATANPPANPGANPAANPAAAPPDEVSIGKVEIQAVKPPPAPAPAKVVRPAVRVQQPPPRPVQRPQPTQTAVKKAPDPTPAATPPPATGSAAPPAPAAAKDSCNPPYYYEGSKKIFKPACL